MDVCEEYVCSKIEFTYCLWDEKHRYKLNTVKKRQEFTNIDEHCRRAFPRFAAFIEGIYIHICKFFYA